MYQIEVTITRQSIQHPTAIHSSIGLFSNNASTCQEGALIPFVAAGNAPKVYFSFNLPLLKSGPCARDNTFSIAHPPMDDYRRH